MNIQYDTPRHKLQRGGQLPQMNTKSPAQFGAVPESLYPVLTHTLQSQASTEYDISGDGEVFWATSQEQNLETLFTAQNVCVQLQEQNRAYKVWAMQLDALAYDGVAVPVSTPILAAERNRMEYRRGWLTEWYLNGPLGLEQGFTIHTPPAEHEAAAVLTLEIAFSGDALPRLVDRQNLQLHFSDSSEKLAFGHLYVTDAKGQALPARFEMTDVEQTVRIVVEVAGAVYPLTIDPIVQQIDLATLLTLSTNDKFGYSVAVSGDKALVGAPNKSVTGHGTGVAYLFQRSASGTWSLYQTLYSGGGTAGDQFGYSVALENDTAVVGTPYENKVYVYGPSSWTSPATFVNPLSSNSRFGVSVAISADTIAVGAEQAVDDTLTQNDRGKVYIFTRTGSTWNTTPSATLADPSPVNSDNFGRSVALHQDTLVVGEPNRSTFQGRALVFVRSGGSWSLQATLVPDTPVNYDYFGASVSTYGDLIVVGAPQNPNLATTDGSGFACVFNRSGTTWTRWSGRLLPDASSVPSSFGYAVALRENTIVVGAPGSAQKAAYIFTRTGPGWSAFQKLTKSSSASFGFAVAFDGGTALVGDKDFSSAQGSAGVYPVYPGAPSNTGRPLWPLNWLGEPFHDNSINLRTGEKMMEATDLVVNTPVGQLTFTRTYRLSKRNNTPYMGISWIHNHAAFLNAPTGNPRKVLINMPNGGELSLTEISPSSNFYQGDPGSDAALDGTGTGNSTYTLYTTDQSKYIFGADGRLYQRIWPGGEKWNYSYSTTAPYPLVSVLDDYGRGLQFSYRTADSFDIGQLWRVGDQSATGLGSASPAGRYVEFIYVIEKQNGVNVPSGKPLLQTVRDVLGAQWTYDYYGQDVGETDGDKYNNLLESLSPAVDVTGSGAAGPAISIEKVRYYTDGNGKTQAIVQSRANGLVQKTLTFQAKGLNITEEKEVIPDSGLSYPGTPLLSANKLVTHLFNNGVYGGVQDEQGNLANQTVNMQYRPEEQSDANANRTKMRWTKDADTTPADASGKHLYAITDAQNKATQFAYNDSYGTTDAKYGTLANSTDAQGHVTEYGYNNSTNQFRSPSDVNVRASSGGTIVRKQNFVYDSHSRPITETLYDASGANKQQEVNYTYYPTGSGGASGLLYERTQNNVNTPTSGAAHGDMTTTHFYDASGRLIKQKENTLFGRCQMTFFVYDAANHIVASLCNYDPGTGADPTTKQQAIDLYDPTQPNKNRVTTYDYDTLGRLVQETQNAGAVKSGSTYAPTITLTAYDALNRVIRKIENYVPNGSITDPLVHNRTDFTHGTNNDQNRVTDTFYNLRGLIRKQIDPLGNAMLYGYDDAGRLVRAIQNASQATYNNEYNGGDPSLQTYAVSGAPDLDILTLNGYDAAGNLIRVTDALGNVILNGFDELNRPVKTIRNASNPTYDLTLDKKLASYTPAMGAGVDQDFIEETEYDAVGRIRKSKDAVGSATLYGYDSLGRSVKTIRFPATPNYFDSYPTDTDLASYPGPLLSPSSLPYEDLISQTVYDDAERVKYTKDPLDRAAWTAYDGFGRVRKTIANAVGTGGPLASDPRSDDTTYPYVPSTASADDRITYTEYDENRRMVRTRDILGNWTLYGYDQFDRSVRTIRNASNPTYNSIGDESLASYTPAGGATADQDVITRTDYDDKGRVAARYDALQRKTVYAYDDRDRVVKTTQNFTGTGVYNPANSDQNLIASTEYDITDRVTATIDPRGTRSEFAYDAVGRQRLVKYAANTALVQQLYTCFDKLGRVLRTIQNYLPDAGNTSPDAKDGSGNWLFNPALHGAANDQNLITVNTLDKAGRIIAVGDPNGGAQLTTYAKDNLTLSTADELGIVSQLRYDKARRLMLTVQNYVAGTLTDPATWIWDKNADQRWEDGTGAAIPFGVANDQNIITSMTYDKAGRVVEKRDPRGNVTQYEYDLLDRRSKLTDPNNRNWVTTYTVPVGSGNIPQGTMSSTLTDPNTKQTQQNMDRLSRLASIAYLSESPKLTPDVIFTYDKQGNRTGMSESNDVSTVRNTTFVYDGANRAKEVDFDLNGSGLNIQAVKYEYDAGGLRTKLIMPGSGTPTVVYNYDVHGRLTALMDWVNPASNYVYDGANRLNVIQHANGLTVSQQFDESGRLRKRTYSVSARTLAQFAYAVNARGHRISGLEAVAQAGSGGTTILPPDPAAPNTSRVEQLAGVWTNNIAYTESTSLSAVLRMTVLGDVLTLTMVRGSDYGMYDLYVDGTLWQSIDGYAASGSDQTISIPVSTEGPHVIEIRNRPDKNAASTGNRLRFKSLATNRVYDLLQNTYSYDGLARLTNATLKQSGSNTPDIRSYGYTYDVAGNRTGETKTVLGTLAATTYNYDPANRLTTSVKSGVTTTYAYNANGNLTSDGMNGYTWDRANRLTAMGPTGQQSTYQYNGMGNRVQQNAYGLGLKTYILDLQSPLPNLLQETFGGETTAYVYGPLGVQQEKVISGVGGALRWHIQDGLGSVRSVMFADMSIAESRYYAPYGEVVQTSQNPQTTFGFADEPTDVSGMVYLRARYHSPALGQFVSLDPAETCNRYAYVHGNPVNLTDPSGLRVFYDDPELDATTLPIPPQGGPAYHPLKPSDPQGYVPENLGHGGQPLAKPVPTEPSPAELFANALQQLYQRFLAQLRSCDCYKNRGEIANFSFCVLGLFNVRPCPPSTNTPRAPIATPTVTPTATPVDPNANPCTTRVVSPIFGNCPGCSARLIAGRGFTGPSPQHNGADVVPSGAFQGNTLDPDWDQTHPTLLNVYAVIGGELYSPGFSQGVIIRLRTGPATQWEVVYIHISPVRQTGQITAGALIGTMVSRNVPSDTGEQPDRAHVHLSLRNDPVHPGSSVVDPMACIH